VLRPYKWLKAFRESARTVEVAPPLSPLRPLAVLCGNHLPHCSEGLFFRHFSVTQRGITPPPENPLRDSKEVPILPSGSVAAQPRCQVKDTRLSG